MAEVEDYLTSVDSSSVYQWKDYPIVGHRTWGHSGLLRWHNLSRVPGFFFSEFGGVSSIVLEEKKRASEMGLEIITITEITRPLEGTSDGENGETVWTITFMIRWKSLGSLSMREGLFSHNPQKRREQTSAKTANFLVGGGDSVSTKVVDPLEEDECPVIDIETESELMAYLV
ncbi:hypothetical protein Fot_24500 [Forsythia ovata]|uniref:Uncharacterized protein n=1 Tax=Forsythia ovata TaxID=205694 RepID=A0ABD1U6H2_9LAMI